MQDSYRFYAICGHATIMDIGQVDPSSYKDGPSGDREHGLIGIRKTKSTATV